MLQARRGTLRLARRSYRCQWRGHADVKPPDPTNADREPDNKPVNEPIGGGDSSGTDSPHAASAGGHEPTHHPPHPEPHNESLGRGFYVSIAALALSFALYKFSRSDPSAQGDPTKEPLITRAIAYYSYYQDEYARRNALHTKMIEQAGQDRHLFTTNPSTRHVELKFPEIFNTGSPYNIPAGHSADLGALKAHYHQENIRAEERRIGRLQEMEVESKLFEQEREARKALLAEQKAPTMLQRMGLQRPDE